MLSECGFLAGRAASTWIGSELNRSAVALNRKAPEKSLQIVSCCTRAWESGVVPRRTLLSAATIRLSSFLRVGTRTLSPIAGTSFRDATVHLGPSQFGHRLNSIHRSRDSISPATAIILN